MVSILDSSSRNLQKLIEQLLDYNRKQADSAVELENVELAPLVETVVSAHSLPARAKNDAYRRRSQSNSLHWRSQCC